MQNTSGIQTFANGKMGELIENIHTFVMLGGTYSGLQTGNFEFSPNKPVSLNVLDLEYQTGAYGADLKVSANPYIVFKERTKYEADFIDKTGLSIYSLLR